MSGNLQVSLRLSPAEIIKIKEFCEAGDISVAAHVRALLRKHSPALNQQVTNAVPLFDPETGLSHVDADEGID